MGSTYTTGPHRAGQSQITQASAQMESEEGSSHDRAPHPRGARQSGTAHESVDSAGHQAKGRGHRAGVTGRGQEDGGQVLYLDLMVTGQGSHKQGRGQVLYLDLLDRPERSSEEVPRSLSGGNGG